jgi:hypothetical protein
MPLEILIGLEAYSNGAGIACGLDEQGEIRSTRGEAILGIGGVFMCSGKSVRLYSHNTGCNQFYCT